MSDSSNNYCVIDALCGIDTASPQISRFTEGFDSIKFLLGKNFDEYTMMIITRQLKYPAGIFQNNFL